MKPRFSEDYYRLYWGEFLKPVPSEDYMDLEGELEYAMKRYDNLCLPEEQINVVRKYEAQKLAKKCMEIVQEQKRVLIAIRGGKAAWGYTCKWQETMHEKEYIQRFEFNCLQLRDFNAKYNL